MSSSIPHSIFINKQKEVSLNVSTSRGKQLIQMKQVSDTRWSCRYSSIKAVFSTFTAIIKTLDEIGDQSHTRSVEARGLLHQISSFPFLLSLVLFEKIFSMTSTLSNLLQSEQISFAAAARCIRATKTALSDIRSEQNWIRFGT